MRRRRALTLASAVFAALALSVVSAGSANAAVSLTMSNTGSSLENLRASYSWSAPDSPAAPGALVMTYVSGGNATPGVSWTLGLSSSFVSLSSANVNFNPTSAATFFCPSGVCISYVTPPSGYGSDLPDGTYSAVLTFARSPSGTSTSAASIVTWDLVTLPPTLTAPQSSSTGTAGGFAVDYTLPETANAGSVSLTFAPTGGCSGSTVTLTMTDSQTVSTTINPATPSGSSAVASVAGTFTAGCTYNVTLSYQDAQNHTAATATATNVLIPGAPGAPTSVSAVGGPSSAALSWVAPAANGSAITSYTATASPGGATCSTAGTSCTVTGLPPGVTYTFTVTATNGAGTGAASAASAGVPISDVPGAPTAASGVAGIRQATVSWTAPAANGSAITGYVATASPGGATCAASAPATSCVVAGLSAGGSYSFTVTATNGVGSGPASAASATVNLADVPGVPQGVFATAGIRQATVSWSAPAANGSAITGYAVTASPGGGSCVAATPATSCLVSGLTAGQTYTFSVVATNAVGDSAASGASSAVAALGDPPPVEPPPVEPPPVEPPPVEPPPVAPTLPQTPVVKVDAPIPPTPNATAPKPKVLKPVPITLRVGKSVTASQVAAYIALARPKGSALRVAMTGRSTKFCRVTKSKSVWRVHGVRAGTCKLTLTMTPKGGQVVTRKVTVPVLKKKR